IQILKNIEAILKELDLTIDSVVKTTVFLTSMEDFKEFNEAYETFFKKDPPARSTVAVKELPKGARIEIEALAFKG
ncbi:RidA family protein, partial [bacterium]|nr:RidA family protein [bacterium]